MTKAGLNKIAIISSTAFLVPAIALALSGAPTYRMGGMALVTTMSPPVFEYAHGTVAADDEFFIGMRAAPGNPFPTNEALIFTDPADLSRYQTVAFPERGDIESMVYDAMNDKVYAELANNHSLDIYAIDPHTYESAPVVITAALDVGKKPAIVTDGTYIYGITDSDPSTVFKVRISDGTLLTDSVGHIPDGHSAAIGIYATSTELYFGGGISHEFEKADAATLHSLARIDLTPCSMTDDMPYSSLDAGSGYVYIGCESEPFGERVHTSDMSTAQFPLPGESFGLFIYGHDLYNLGRDGDLDIFPELDIGGLHRYPVIDDLNGVSTRSKGIELNELFYSPATAGLYFTAWGGIRGLFRIATTTLS